MRNRQVNAAALAAGACAIVVSSSPAAEPLPAGRAVRDEVTTTLARFEGSDLVIVGGEVRIRGTDLGARRFVRANVVSLRMTGRRALVTADGETLMVTAARYDGGRFTFTSLRFGEFPLEPERVKSLSFEGADRLYAREIGGFVSTAGDLVEPHPVEGSLAVAYVRLTGAETVETFSATLEAEAVRANWRHTLAARSTFTETDGARAADLGEASYKLDRFISERAFAYTRVGASRDDVAGIDLRAGVGAGAGFRFLVGPRHELAGEAGYEFQHEDSAAEANDVSFGRVAIGYAFKVDAAKAFSEKADVLLGEGRTRVRSETALTAKLNDRFSVRLGIIIEHDTKPPVGTPETTTRTAAAVVWNF
jgi:putative salt-induced outer membrane protein YdiY